ncbi:MAG: hypothetical protein ACPL6D_08955 [Thermodesulfobacteriota bacterium]
MAEIKSTLELALEKTKKIGISDEERQEIKQKEVLQKVSSLSHRYREGLSSLHEILKEIEKMDEKIRSWVVENLLNQWIETLSLDDEGERLFKGIESLKHRDTEEMKQKFYDLLTLYQEEKEEIKKRVRIQLVEILRKEHIYGSAVEPKLEESELYKKESEDLDRIYRMKLEELKEKLKTL